MEPPDTQVNEARAASVSGLRLHDFKNPASRPAQAAPPPLDSEEAYIVREPACVSDEKRNCIPVSVIVWSSAESVLNRQRASSVQLPAGSLSIRI